MTANEHVNRGLDCRIAFSTDQYHHSRTRFKDCGNQSDCSKTCNPKEGYFVQSTKAFARAKNAMHGIGHRNAGIISLLHSDADVSFMKEPWRGSVAWCDLSIGKRRNPLSSHSHPAICAIANCLARGACGRSILQPRHARPLANAFALYSTSTCS